MFGVLLTIFGTSIEEASATLKKKNLLEKRIGAYGVVVLQMSVAMIVFVFIGIVFPSTFYFSTDSLPTFLLRVPLEILQVYVTIQAIALADRTTFAFLRSLTIPLLLVVDVVMGYILSPFQAVGILLIVFVLMGMYWERRISRKAIGLVLFSALNPVIGISLFKYNITHYNSVVAEEGLMIVILLLFGVIGNYIKEDIRPWKVVMSEKTILVEAILQGMASVFQSFAYTFLPPSVLIATKRSTAIFWALVSGKLVFHERHFVWKGMAMVFLISGIVLLSGTL